jgi:hypothetical protein
MNKIAEQKYNVNILFDLFNEYKTDSDVAQVITEMTPIKSVFDKLQADSLGNISIDQKTFDELTKMFENQRNSFISTK